MPEEETQVTPEATEKPVSKDDGGYPALNLTHEEALREISKLRKENEKRRRLGTPEDAITKLEKYEQKEREESVARKALEESEAIKRGEYESVIKAEKDSARALRSKAREVIIEAKLERLLADSVDYETVAAEVQRRHRNLIKFDDDTMTVSGLEEAVEALRETKPTLFRSADPIVTSRGTSPGSGPRGTSVQKGPPEFDPTKSIADQLAAFR